MRQHRTIAGLRGIEPAGQRARTPAGSAWSRWRRSSDATRCAAHPTRKLGWMPTVGRVSPGSASCRSTSRRPAPRPDDPRHSDRSCQWSLLPNTVQRRARSGRAGRPGRAGIAASHRRLVEAVAGGTRSRPRPVEIDQCQRVAVSVAIRIVRRQHLAEARNQQPSRNAGRRRAARGAPARNNAPRERGEGVAGELKGNHAPPQYAPRPARAIKNLPTAPTKSACRCGETKRKARRPNRQPFRTHVIRPAHSGQHDHPHPL